MYTCVVYTTVNSTGSELIVDRPDESLSRIALLAAVVTNPVLDHSLTNPTCLY